MSKKKRLAIFDADSFVFKAGYPLKDQLNMLGEGAARERLDNHIKSILRTIKADCFVGFIGDPITSKGNFRFDVATIKPYKGQRPTVEWMEYFKPRLKQYMKDKWGFYSTANIEADDAVGIAFNQFKDEYDVVMIFEDKDAIQFAGWLPTDQSMTNYNFNKYHKGIHKYTHYEGLKHFWIQNLTGG